MPGIGKANNSCHNEYEDSSSKWLKYYRNVPLMTLLLTTYVPLVVGTGYGSDGVLSNCLRMDMTPSILLASVDDISVW